MQDSESWEKLTYGEKNDLLYLRQKAMLELFLERGAITEKQFEKSLHDLTEKRSGKNGRTD